MVRKKKKKGILRDIDWSADPQTLREIFAVILIILGVLFLLSIFRSAGSFGNSFLNGLINLFGILGYIIPFVFILLGTVLMMPSRFEIKPIQSVGIILSFIFVPALFSYYGGSIGMGISYIFRSTIGPVASFLVLFGLSIVSLLLALNTSLRTVWQKIRPSSGLQDRGDQSISVFTTFKRKVGAGESDKTSAAALAFEKDSTWKFPPLDLLQQANSKATSGNIPKNVEIIQKTLRDFGIDVSMGTVNVGPTVTQYTLKPAEGMKLANIVARQNDLALSLAKHPIRIEAPIPGKSTVGIEVQNDVKAKVALRDILESDEFKSVSNKSNLTIALGRDVAGAPVAVDLAKMPHLLIAGATGSGKTIGIHSIILSFLYQNSPSSLKLILVDPKRVEFTHHNGIPHLLTPVITEIEQTISALRWAIAEMDRRFRLFSETHKRDIYEFNQGTTEGRLPYIVICIDELADLMSQAANEVESAIVRLAQMARATGIHLILATQRPSVDVITGLIKANITSRIAFSVASQTDSRTILDMAGAEKLLGSGDMLYLASDIGKPKRIQSCLVTTDEVKKVTDFTKEQRAAAYDESILKFRPAPKGLDGNMAIDDDLFEDAKMVVIQAGKASASLLQRRLRVGYARAARLLDLLEQEGFIGPQDGAKPRDVLTSREEMDIVPKDNPTFRDK